jgi:replicative DNA helicase
MEELPYDEFTESLALGMVLRGEKNAYEILPALELELFHGESNHAIAAAILGAWAEDKAHDPVTVCRHLDRHGALQKVGGSEYVYRLAQIPTLESASPQSVLRTLDNYRLRRVVLRIRQRPPKPDGEEEVATLLAELLAARKDRGSLIISAEDATVRALQEIENGEELAVRVGLRDFDSKVGLRRKDLMLIAARTSVGKTVVGVSFATGACKTGGAALIHSLEMDAPRIIKRQLANLTTIENFDIQHGRLSDFEKEEILRAAQKTSKQKIWYIDQSLPWHRCIALYEYAIAMHPEITILIVDYIGLIKGIRAERRDLEIAQITGDLKSLAKRLNIATVALTQLNRKTLDNQDEQPTLGNLREGGAQEQDADIVALLWAPDFKRNKDTGFVGPERLICDIAKGRDSRVGYLEFMYDRRYCRLADYNGELDAANEEA